MWNGNNNPNDHRNRHYPPQPPPGYHYRQSPPTYPDPRYPPHPYGYGPYWPPPPPHQPPLGDRPRSGSHGENVYYPEVRHHSGEHGMEEETSMTNSHRSTEDKAVADITVSDAAPRGKPEAMAQALAAAKIESNREEVAEMKRKEEERMKTEDAEEEVEAVAEVEVEAEPVAEEDEDEAIAEPVSQPVAVAKKPSETKKKSPARKKKPKSQPSASALEVTRSRDILSRPVDPVSEEEWGNLDALMNQFCRIPLLAEFSRPVSLLHPELVSTYSKIVKHPLDLGHVCRGIRRRQYKNLRDVRLDMWRVFANCVKYHSHPNNKEAVPSFVSIALHLREYFNSLWNEYMLPSELPENASTTIKEMFQQRQQDRISILENSGVIVINKKIINIASETIKSFLANGGRVDKLDKDDIFGPNAKEKDRDLEVVVANITKVQEKLAEKEDDYGIEPFYQDLKAAYTSDVLEENPALRNRIGNRITRMFWKLFLPLHEANSRGVAQSSIWGNIAATIWARESSKKPYWPALCLGILAPEHQRESWHDRITQRNEMRLPEKLRAPLETSKNKCIAAQQRQPLSYFLVEFLGTHEFIWVRETDIIENFDAEKDPNKDSALSSKKKRSSRSATSSVIGSKTYATALEECTWALEEYESVLQDCYSYTNEGESEQEEDGDDVNYSYSLLAQSDDEADDEDSQGYAYDESTMSLSDVDEANFLLEHSGLLDTSSAGRKNAKKRAQAMKKKTVEKNSDSKSKGRKDLKPKKDSKRKDAQRAKEEKTREAQRAKDLDREHKKEEKELEKRRKRRMREREKALRLETRKNKKRRSSVGDEEDDRGLTLDKRARATAIVKAYLTRLAKDDDFKSLGIGGVMSIPASMVDSTGLLGMALAFRSAAGEIPVPDDGEEFLAKLKPWTAIDTETPKTSAKRIEALEQKIGLLEKQIQKKKNETKIRKDLAREAIAKRLRMEEDIEADDELARRNPFKKKKRYSSPKPGKKFNPTKERQDNAEDDEDDDAGSERRGTEDDDDGEDEDDEKTAVSTNQSDEDVGRAASADIDAMDVENP